MLIACFILQKTVSLQAHIIWIKVNWYVGLKIKNKKIFVFNISFKFHKKIPINITVPLLFFFAWLSIDFRKTAPSLLSDWVSADMSLRIKVASLPFSWLSRSDSSLLIYHSCMTQYDIAVLENEEMWSQRVIDEQNSSRFRNYMRLMRCNLIRFISRFIGWVPSINNRVL